MEGVCLLGWPSVLEMSLNNSEPITTAIGTMWVENGVLWHRIETHETITDDHAVSVVDAIRQLSGDHPLPAIVDMSKIGFATAAARSRFATDIDESMEIATALLVRDGPGRLMASAWTKLSRTKRPVAVSEGENGSQTMEL